MANNIIAMDSLKKGAVRVYEGMTVVQMAGLEEALHISNLQSKFNGCFAMNNSTICFVDDHEVFVTYYTELAYRSLIHAGLKYCGSDFYVPFSNGDYPKEEEAKWNDLFQKARQRRKEEFFENCCAYCDEYHIGELSDEVLSNCLEIPFSGFRVKNLYYESWCWPVITHPCLDSYSAEKLGSFCFNNGRVVFVYRNGKTYVTKGYGILDELRVAGYTKSDLFVPLSNGEEIIDPHYKKLWESIRKC